MKIGFNEGCNRFCENHSVLEDLDLCEKYGFDYIDIQSECLDREIAAGKYTIDDLGAWFADPKHHLKMLSYNALIFFNMKQTQEEKDAVMAKLDQIIADCNKLGCKMIVVVPSMDLTVPATVDEIREDAVAVLKEMVKKVEPHGIKLSIEFCGAPTMSINRFEYAYDIVTEVNHPLVGITLDQYHFHAMASEWAALEKADGKKIFVWHLNGMENMPCGAAYNNDEKRLWPGEPATASITSVTQIPSRRSALRAMSAPWRCSVRTTTSCPTRRISRRPLRLPRHMLRSTGLNNQ